jgi:CheY-like chemotaxis protein
MLAMLLEAAGHQVVVEHSARRALLRAGEEHPEVCLLDIGLPEIDGNELAQRLRADPGTAGAVLIAVTGYGQEKDLAQSQAAGFDHHLVKPVDTRALASILATVRRP